MSAGHWLYDPWVLQILKSQLCSHGICIRFISKLTFWEFSSALCPQGAGNMIYKSRNFSQVSSIVMLHSTSDKDLTFENLCQPYVRRGLAIWFTSLVAGRMRCVCVCVCVCVCMWMCVPNQVWHIYLNREIIVWRQNQIQHGYNTHAQKHTRTYAKKLYTHTRTHTRIHTYTSTDTEEERKREKASECVWEKFILVSTFTHSHSARFCPNS